MAGPGDRRGRLRKPGPDRARGGRGIGPRRHRRRAPHRQRRARRPDPAGNRRRKPSDGEDIQLTLDPLIQAEDRSRCWPESAKPTRRRARRRSSWTRAARRSWRWRTGRRSTPTTSPSASNEDLVNKATGFTYEPGSTFKAFTVSAALEEKLVTPDTAFTLPPSIQVADRTIEDAEPRGDRDAERRRDPRPLLQRRRGRRSGSRSAPRNSAAGSTASASAARPGSSSRPRSRGSCSTLDEYSGSTMGNLPIGQGLSVTPMQMVAGYTAIANGGILQAAAADRAGRRRSGPRAEGHRVIDAEVAAQVREMLEGVLAPGGTASEVSVPGYTLAGKTGTAAGGRKRDLLGDQIRRLVHRLRAGAGPEVAGGGDRRPAAGGNLRRLGGGAGVRQIAAFALPYLGVPPE